MNIDIKNTLEYVDKKFNDIKITLVKDIKSEEKCKFLSNEIADIISNLNKCYDYCSTDIINSQNYSLLNQKQLEAFKKCKKYFPLNEHSLNEKKKAYSYVKIVNLDLYNKMLQLVKKISNNAQVQTNKPNTYSSLKYGMVKDIRKLCNNDKHCSSLKIIVMPQTKVRVERADGMIIEMSTLNCKGNYPPISIPVGEGGQGFIGNSYVVKDFDEEIETFLIHRIGITKKVIEEVYSYIT